MQLFYTVRAGDTLSSIALRRYIPLRSLIEANNLAAPYLIFPGQQLSMPPGVKTYVVRLGDSVFSIAQKYGVSVTTLSETNGIEPPYVIMPGTILIIPGGLIYYVVRQGDTLYRIALKYNVTLNGQPRPDLIIEANSGLTPAIFPGMRLIIPYPPAGGTGWLAAVMTDGFGSFLQLHDPSSGKTNEIAVDEADRSSAVFWSRDDRKLAYIGRQGIISIVDAATGRITKIDQLNLPAFIDWSHDSKKLVYSTGELIRIYDVTDNTYKSISRPEASYVQWLPNYTGLFYEAKDSAGISQLYRSNTDGSSEKRITNNTNGPLNEVRLSPNARYALYTSPGVSISEIYTIELATGLIARIPGGPEAKNYYPAWSPESTMIAYSSTQFINGKYYSLIRVSGVKGEGDSTLAIASCYATPVVWSPDGNKIAYMSGCREDVPPVEVWSIDIRKQVPVNMLSGFLYFNIDW